MDAPCFRPGTSVFVYNATKPKSDNDHTVKPREDCYLPHTESEPPLDRSWARDCSLSLHMLLSSSRNTGLQWALVLQASFRSSIDVKDNQPRKMTSAVRNLQGMLEGRQEANGAKA